MTPRKHCDIIKKWADGAEVQWFYPEDRRWYDTSCPMFEDEGTYRIKPKIVRIALHRAMNGSNFPVIWSKACIFAEIEKYDTFIQWLTEEIEYEM